MVQSSEVRLYLGIFVLFTLAITGTLVAEHDYDSYGSALRAASFQTAAILTTTGFGTADFDRWPDLCRNGWLACLFLLAAGICLALGRSRTTRPRITTL